MRCRERISRTDSEAFKTKIVSPAKVLQTTDLCTLTNSLSSIRMEIFHSFREMISLKITELLIIRWSTQMMRHSVSLNLTRYMLRKTRIEILIPKTSIRAEKSLLSTPWSMVMQIKPRKSFPPLSAWIQVKTICSPTPWETE